MKGERPSGPKGDPTNRAVDDWWKSLKDKGLLSKAVDDSSERYPLVNVHRLPRGRPEQRRQEPRSGVFLRRPGTIVASAAVAALGLGTLGFFLSWSLAMVHEQEVFASAVEQSISFSGQKNGWKDEMENSLLGAFFLPASKE